VDLAIELTISSGRPYLPQGLDGAEPLIGGIGTRYYSVPGLVVEAAASSLTLGDRRVAIKSGTLWFDHQWGLGLVPTGASRYASLRASANLAPQSVPGWDFFLMNFDGPYSMTLNSLHSEKNLPFINQTGPKPPPPMDAPVVGKFMDRYGTVFNVSGQLRVSEWRKTNHTPNPAKYTNVPTWVPHGWEITLQEKVVPEHLRRLLITAICDDAQALFFANGAQYVEAATDLIDANDKKMGRGYAEAVSYVDNLPTIISLAGMPVTDELLALFKTTPPSLLMKLGSFLYLLQPWARQEVDRLLQCASLPPTARPSTCH
jgi:hypothetical protein